MRFLNVKTDYAFKRVFGAEGSKPLLIGFLNAILGYQGEKAIADLTIVDPYQIPMLKGMKDTFVDVRAVLSNGKHVIIEMQVLNVPGFEKRVLHNAAKQYSIQLMIGEDYTLLNPVIALTFTDFILFEGKDHINRYRLMERDRFIEYSDDVELIFIELPKFTLELDALQHIQDKWIYFIKNAGSLEYIPDTLAREPNIEEAFRRINEAAMTPEELELQFKQRDFIILQRGSLELAEKIGREDGMEKGREKGREEGREEGAQAKALEVARNLLDVLDDATIAAKTGLSAAQIKQLRLAGTR